MARRVAEEAYFDGENADILNLLARQGDIQREQTRYGAEEIARTRREIGQNLGAGVSNFSKGATDQYNERQKYAQTTEKNRQDKLDADKKLAAEEAKSAQNQSQFDQKMAADKEQNIAQNKIAQQNADSNAQKGVKEPNMQDQNAAALVKQAAEDDVILNELEASGFDSGSKMRNVASMGEYVGLNKPAKQSQYDAATERLITALQQAGANDKNINSQDRTSVIKGYIPTAGDDPETIKGKHRARESRIKELMAIHGQDSSAWSAQKLGRIETARTKKKAPRGTAYADDSGRKEVVKKQVSPSTGKTKIIYSDGSEEIVDAPR